MTRRYSNRQINEAGEVLKSKDDYSYFQIIEAENVLTYWRTIHAYSINTFQATLRDKIKRIGISNAIVAQRLKRSVSIVSKLQRFDSMKLATMQDIAGIRAIVKNIMEVRQVEKSYRQSKFLHVLKGEKDYILEPANSGYRGVHLIFQFNSLKKLESDGLKIELQIRTKLQHTWATAVETMGTFLEFSLKSSQGPKEWLEFFSLVSAGFAILENCPISNKHSSLSHKELFKLIIAKAEQLNVQEKLSAFSIAANHISTNTNKKKYKYNLITLDLNLKTVSIKSYPAYRLEQANIDYTKAERDISDGARIHTVLVSTGSVQSLRKAYPSYFLDSKEFLNKLLIFNSRLTKME